MLDTIESIPGVMHKASKDKGALRWSSPAASGASGQLEQYVNRPNRDPLFCEPLIERRA